MRFVRIGDEILRLDLVTHIKEGCKEETLYGRSVRKTSDSRHGWLEVHFVSGEVIKIEGEGAEVLRRVLDEEIKVWDPASTAVPPSAHAQVNAHPYAAPPAGRKLIPHESRGSGAPAPRPAGEQRPAFRHGNGS